MKNLTIVILTYNEEANIGPLLDTLAKITAPIFVVDSYSTDDTLNILESRGIHYVQHEFKNYAAQRNWAQANLPTDSEWVLHLDAGEKLTPGMVRWINEEFDPEVTGVNGYMFARRAIFLGRWIKYGGYHPIYHLRLYRWKKGHCENKVYDQHFVVEGEVRKTPKNADLEDGVMSSLRDFTVSHARWAVFEAVESIIAEEDPGEVDAKLFGNPIERKRWLKTRIFQRSPLFLRSFLYLFHRYIIKGGFRDGIEGLVFHFLQGFWFRFLVDSTILEIRKELEHQELPEVVSEKYGLDINKFLNHEPDPSAPSNEYALPSS